MARKSGWAQFAENFKTTYGAVKDFAKEDAIGDINSRSIEEQFDDAGVSTGYKYGDTLYDTRNDTGGLIRPTDMQIQSQDFKDTQRVMSRFGDYKGAQEMGLSQANLEAKQEANRLARDTHKFNVDQAAANLKHVQLGNVGIGIKNTVDESNSAVTLSKNDMDLRDNNSMVGYRDMMNAGATPKEGQEYLLKQCESGSTVFCDTLKKIDATTLHQKTNEMAQFKTSIEVALGKGQAGGSEAILAIVDAQDGIEGNVRWENGEDGSVSLVELDKDGNPTNAAPWTGKDWEDFSQNARKRLDPVNALAITAKQVEIDKNQSATTLLDAQALEALSKAKGSGSQEKMELLITELAGKFQADADSAYSRAKTPQEKKAILDVYKYELRNTGNTRNAKGGYDQPNTGGIGGGNNTGTPTAGNGGGKDILGKLSNLSNTTGGVSTDTGASVKPVTKKVLTKGGLRKLSNLTTGGVRTDTGASVKPVTKKVLTKAQTYEQATLDKEVSDIQAKVAELSNMKGLQAGGKASNEIQKLRKRITGIEQRKYKIQN